jgi:predicted CXXCH cytochrome family protein
MRQAYRIAPAFLALLMFSAGGLTAGTNKGTAPAIAELQERAGAGSDACLSCHGPFEALRDKTSGYVSPGGMAVNPHITFDRTTPNDPHASGEGVIECTECHRPHPLPVTEPVPAATIDLCLSCHHTATIRACSDCH